MAKKIVTLPNGTTYEYDTDTGTGTLIKQGDPLIGGTNNPAPVDNSLYQQPPANPINIPAGTPVTDAAKIDWSDVAVDDGLDEYAENYADVEPIGQTSYPYKKVTQDPPEEIPGMEGDDDFGSTSVNDYGDDESDTGAPTGLNKDPKSVTEVNNPKDAASINGTKPTFDADLSKVEINPRPNELNQFTSHTYNLALYMLNSKSYVNLLTAPSSPRAVLNDSLLLMRSGGVGNEGRDSALEQQADFSDQFFIDNLQLNSISVGPSKTKQNTNVTDITFTITEPRGVTLLEKLQTAAALTLASTKERYIHTPYLLEIKFKGYDENGQPMTAKSTPKYIPIKITEMDFDVTASGTEYTVRAMPFAHSLFGQINSTIPMNIELTAGTIGNIFSDGIKSFTVQPEQRITAEDEDGVSETTIPEKVKYGDSFKTLGEALTDYQRKRTQPTVKNNKVQKDDKTFYNEEQEVPAAAEGYDTYSFTLATEIANARLNVDAIFDALDTPTPTGQKKDDGKANKSQFQAYAASFGAGVSLDKDRKTFKINAGTDVTKLLNLVIMHSDYMDKNIDEKISAATSEGVGIKWFKIKPIIKSAEGPGKGFDGKDGRYKYHIEYVVEPSVIYYQDFPWAPKSKPKGGGYHKVYDYIFSGKNTEVLSFDLKFRTAYMEAMTAGTGRPFSNKNADNTFAPLTKEQPQSAEGNTVNGKDSLTRARAKDLFSNIMSDGVDMVDLNLGIIGDPAYLTTSDYYWQDKVRKGEQYTSAFMPDGTINFELSQPFVQVNLKTPVDYDEITGLANPNTATNSSFSGVYMVTSIESTFSGGQFQQKIVGIRAPMQVTKAGVARDAADAAGKERTETKKDETKTNTPTDIQSGGAQGEFGGLGKAQATVVEDGDFAAGGNYYEDDDDGPYTSPTVNNAITARIAQGPDLSVQTIPDVNADISSDWTPPASFFKSEPPTFTPTPTPVRVTTANSLVNQDVETI
jgi:hypothetical protein